MKTKYYGGRTLPTIMVIPDTQVTPNTPIEHLEWAGKWAAKQKPDIIVHIGDHWDMQSLSMYDKGKKKFEGRTYKADIDAGNRGMDTFMQPIHDEVAKCKRNKRPRWNPELHFALGNHEERITRAINLNRELEDTYTFDDFNLEEHGWSIHEFCKPFFMHDIAFAHYFTSGTMGRPVSSARALVTKKHMSCVMGHVQQTEIDLNQKRADGRQLTGLFAGIFYQHNEDYLGPQGNEVRRQVWMLHNVDQGQFDLQPVPLEYLRERYAK